MKMDVHPLELGDMQNLVYLIADRETHRAAVLDPGWDVPAILREAGNAIITDILVSHWHEDHINGIDELVEATGARVHLLQAEADYWNPDATRLVCHADGDCIRVGSLDIRLVHTPGHSPGSACFHADGALFTGDTLFVYGCGRCDLPGGDAHAMYYTLRRMVETFPPETVLYPGHDYAGKAVSTLAEQILLNPFLHQDSAEAFVAFRAEHNNHRHPPYQPVMRGEPAW
jgi:glyoxylase-like metal-dependent hydrolase (beta-lactamase superfamily II)